MSEQTLLDITLLGREYRVSCQPDEREALLKAAFYVDEKMREIKGRTQSGGEKLAVMTALNIAHELLQLKLPGGIDVQDFRRRIDHMQSRVDQALALQENLF